MAQNRMYLVNDRLKVCVYLAKHYVGEWVVVPNVETTLAKAFSADDAAYDTHGGFTAGSEPLSWRLAYEDDQCLASYAECENGVNHPFL